MDHLIMTRSFVAVKPRVDNVKLMNIKICFLTKIAHKWLRPVIG